MNYFIINTDKTCGGVTETKPQDNNWTLVPYLGGFVKEYFNGEKWIESASIEQINLDKQNKIDALKKECYNELALTDWYFVRKMDIGVEVPIEVIEQRNAIRQKYNDLINKI